MILVQPPKTIIETIETIDISGHRQAVSGQSSVENVKIVCQDRIAGSKNEVWDKLKYGVMPDLADAMYNGTKIDKIAFPEDGVILHGVSVIEMDRTELWNGRIFECRVDAYEVINKC